MQGIVVGVSLPLSERTKIALVVVIAAPLLLVLMLLSRIAFSTLLLVDRLRWEGPF
jgi:hypothetical protein